MMWRAHTEPNVRIELFVCSVRVIISFMAYMGGRWFMMYYFSFASSLGCFGKTDSS